MDNSPLVSVIVPFYNVSQTIENCLSSLLKSNYKEIQLIFVNDFSTDNSIEIINEFIKKHEDLFFQIIIVSHTENMGVAAARNSGLNEAHGEYVYFIDADDWIEHNAISVLVKNAIEKQSDLVGCNWFLSFNKNERIMNQKPFSNPKEAIMMILKGEVRWNLWLFLVKRSLYEENNIRFIQNMNMGEDLYVTLRLLVYAKSVSYIDTPLYHYNQNNPLSMTKHFNNHTLNQIQTNVNSALNHLRESEYYVDVIRLEPFLKLHIKLPLLISNDFESYSKWRMMFPEANKYAFKNCSQSFRIRVIQWLANKKIDFLIWVHYWLLVRVIYGIIYR